MTTRGGGGVSFVSAVDDHEIGSTRTGGGASRVGAGASTGAAVATIGWTSGTVVGVGAGRFGGGRRIHRHVPDASCFRYIAAMNA